MLQGAPTTSHVPRDFGEQLARLSPGLTIVVPNDLLLTWFPSGHPDRTPDEVCKTAAQAFASSFGCAFHYFPIGGGCEQGDGRFHKARASAVEPRAMNRQS
jgi:hypothetical protein